MTNYREPLETEDSPVLMEEPEQREKLVDVVRKVKKVPKDPLVIPEELENQDYQDQE